MATQPDAAVAASPPSSLPSSLCDKLIIRVWLNLLASLLVPTNFVVLPSRTL